jgi:hypothetical protein
MVTIDIAPLIEHQPKREQKEQEQEQSDDEEDTKPKGCLANWLSDPRTILFLSLCFFTGYISFIYEEGGFSQQFLHFGPGTTDQNTTQFLGIVLDTWPKVGLMYLAGFISSLMSTYYSYAMTNNLHSYIWNRAIKKVPFSKRWTYVVIFTEPFFMQVLEIITFFTSLTMQFQFIIPQFIGAFIIEIPFTLQRLQEKQFEHD